MTSPQPPHEGRPNYPQDPAQPLGGARQFPPHPGRQPSDPGPAAQQAGVAPPNQRRPGPVPPPGQIPQLPGAAGPPMKNSTVKVVAIVAAATVLVCCGGGSALTLLNYKLNRQQSTANNSSVSNPLDVAQPNLGTTPTASPTMGRMGQAVDGSAFQLTLSKVKCGVARVGSAATLFEVAKGQYCLATVTAKNITDTNMHFGADFASATGRDGVLYRADSSAMTWANYTQDEGVLSSWEEIGPGDSHSGVLVFDIPKNIMLVKINIPDEATNTVAVAVTPG